MGTINKNRYISFQCLIDKEGTLKDVTDYVTSCSINHGDVSGIGSGGNDGTVMNATINFKKDFKYGLSLSEYNSLSPLHINSQFNDVEALLLPDRDIYIKAKSSDIVQKVTWFIGNGTNEYFMPEVDENIIIPETLRILNAETFDTKTFAYLETKTFAQVCLDYFDEIDTLTWDSVDEKDFKDYNVNWSTFKTVTYQQPDVPEYVSSNNSILLTSAIAIGKAFAISYSIADRTTLKTIFHGVLGDSINPGGPTISITCRDKTKRLQDLVLLPITNKALPHVEGEAREYDQNDTVNFPLITTLMNNLLSDAGAYKEDGVTNETITVYPGTTPAWQVTPNPELWQYKTLWDTLTSIASQIGFYIGYYYDTTTNDYLLTLIDPPRTKTTADYTFSESDEILGTTLATDDLTMRNSVTIFYMDALSGKRLSVHDEDATSIANFRRRTILIDTKDTQGITTAADANNMLNAIMGDLKDYVYKTQVTLPFFEDLKLFDLTQVTIPTISTLPLLVSVESINHNIDFNSMNFRTTYTGVSKVRGANRLWANKATKIGLLNSIPSSSSNLAKLYSIAPPNTFAGSVTYLTDKTKAIINLSWKRSNTGYGDSYLIEYSTNGTDFLQIATPKHNDLSVTQNFQFQVNVLATSTVHYFRIKSSYLNNVNDDWVTLNYTLNADSTVPSVPTGLTTEEGDTLVKLSWNKNSEIDIDFYEVQMKQGSGGTYVTVGRTTSDRFTVENLNSMYTYYFKIRAVDLLGYASNYCTEVSGNANINKVIHIRNQTQFDDWMSSLVFDEITTSPTEITSYSKVIFHYVNNGLSYSYQYFYEPTSVNKTNFLKAKKMEFEGADGDVTIQINGDLINSNEVNNIFTFKNLETKIKGLKFEYRDKALSNASEYVSIIKLSKYSSSNEKQKIDIEENDFYYNQGYITGISYNFAIYDTTDTNFGYINISRCTFQNMGTSFITVGSGIDRKLNINNNIFKTTDRDCDKGYALQIITPSNNITFEKNDLSENMIGFFALTDDFDFYGVLIKGNRFYIKDSDASSIILLNAFTNVINFSGFSITENYIDIKDLSAGTTDFVKFISSTGTSFLRAGNINGNFATVGSRTLNFLTTVGTVTQTSVGTTDNQSY
jgi:hypothetical protein